MKENSETVQLQTIRLLWNYTRPYATRRWVALIGAACTSLAGGFLSPFILSKFFEQLQTGTVSLNASWGLVGVFLLTQIWGEIVGWRIVIWAAWSFQTAAQRDLYHAIFAKLSSETLDFHANRFGGSLVSQAGKLNGAFERFWDTVIFQFVPSITAIIAATVILSQLFWQYALVLLAVSILYVIAVFFGSRFLRQRNREEAQASTKMTGWLADMITNIVTIKSYAGEDFEQQQAMNVSDAWRHKALRSMRGFLGVSSIYATLGTVLTTLALIAAIIASEQQLISIATVYLALSYTFTVSRYLWEMNSIMRNYNRVMGDAYDMVVVLDTPTRLVDESQRKLRVQEGRLSIENVSFTHDNGEGVQIFHKFSLEIKPGERIGLVGHSGSGKSSLVRLLLRFSDVDSGKILIDGQNIAKLSQRSLRQQIAYVPQEPLLFHRSLLDNIRYGRVGATEAEVERAAKLAHAHEFITQLPAGYETLVGERGVKLSGGQRQRIAIARAILKDASLLILDEATSALDSESEQLIQASLEDLMAKRTSIVIAHRLSTIAKLDRIVVLENGRVIEDGSHATLLKQGGTYAKLWRHQSGGFIDVDE